MMKCEKCNGEVFSKGTLNSGNSKYVVWKCKNCSHEMMRCLGLIQYV